MVEESHELREEIDSIYLLSSHVLSTNYVPGTALDQVTPPASRDPSVW